MSPLKHLMKRMELHIDGLFVDWECWNLMSRAGDVTYTPSKHQVSYVDDRRLPSPTLFEISPIWLLIVLMGMSFFAGAIYSDDQRIDSAKAACATLASK